MTGRKGKVVVAMSGGVDSSAAAALLLRQGYEVIGCFMRLGSPGESLDAGPQEYDAAQDACAADAANGPARIGHQGCCSIADAADARLVAAQLGVPFYVHNFKRHFSRIMDYFVSEYAAGRTPNPCVRCNDWLKFGALHDAARSLGADFIASGHYARIERRHDGPALLRGVDRAKDQSYVLFGAPRDRLRRMLLPIGAFSKARVRELAEDLGLPVFDKPDSQEICFVPDRDYAGFIERRAPHMRAKGRIVDKAGAVLGQHEGQHRFTVGQRRGVGVALGRPVYVVDRDPATNVVTVGDETQLACAAVEAREVNWLAPSHRPGAPIRILAQFRAHGSAAPATARVSPADDAVRVDFDESQLAVAPGQAIVCYDEAESDRVLGGGWIVSAERAG